MNKLNSKAFASTIWIGPTAKLIERVHGSKSPVSFFVSKAREMHLVHKVSGPPYDPAVFAQHLGIRIEDVDDMAIDGCITRFPGESFLIRLKRNSDAHRRNFTIAHEIAHTFVYADQEEFLTRHRGNSIYDPEEEHLCDLAAAELLMPWGAFKRDLLKRQKPTKGITPFGLFELMERYNVSLQAIAIRACNIIDGLACVIWRNEPLPKVSWATPRSYCRLLLCPTGKTSVETTRMNGGLAVRNDSFYRSGKRIIKATASLRLKSGEILSVLQPHRMPLEQGLQGNALGHNADIREEPSQLQLELQF